MDEKGKAYLAIVAGCAIRLVFWLTSPITGDGGLNFQTSKYLAEHLALPPVGVPGVIPLWYPPLFHIITAVIYRLTGILTLTPLLFGVAGLVMFRLFCARFYPKQALNATVILAFLPFHIYYSSVGYFETLMFFLAVCAFHCHFSFLESGDRRDLEYAMFLSALCALTHYHGFVVLAAISLHLFTLKPRSAAVFFVGGLLSASPWYVRNYAVFGNPIWPKFGGGYYPDDLEVNAGAPVSAAALSLISPQKWASLFFDFWVGAPNSGDGLGHKLEIASARLPIVYLPLLLWLISAASVTLLAARGAYGMREGKRALLPAILFAGSLVPFASAGSARMFVSLVPFLAVAAAEGLAGIGYAHKRAALFLAVIILVAGSYAYAYTYHGVRAAYQPFFDEMRANIPPSAKVIMPFNVQECLYFSGRQCLRLGSMGGATPKADGSDMDAVLAGYGADYICCTSINWAAQTPSDKAVCDGYKAHRPVIEYVNADAWGRCWSAD